MASTNVELVRSIHAAFERGDWGSPERANPEIELVFADGPAPGNWTGLAGMARGFRGWLSAWEGARVVVEEYRELDGERVLVFLDLVGRGKTSGMELEQMRARSASLYHVRGGKVTRIVVYFDRERVLADLGLPRDSAARE
jgi:ketosteroid isomerase-like protein